MKRLLLAFSIVTLIATGVFGQSPRLLPFQGRLTDAQGNPVANGVKLIQFQIYGGPVGGNALWAGEVHRTTVNGGLVNVMLGTRNPFPLDRADKPDQRFFDGAIYLQITIDTSGSETNGPDGQITAADPPLLPRQIIIPPPFAQEAVNAHQLAGFGWGDLLDSNDPRTGRFDGSRLIPGSLSGGALKDGSVSQAVLADGSVSTAKLQDASVASPKLKAGAVTESALADGSVTSAKIQSALLAQISKVFTGKPDRIVYLKAGGGWLNADPNVPADSFTIPTNMWAVIKASLSVHLILQNYGGPPGNSGFSEGVENLRTVHAIDSKTEDAYALSGSVVTLSTLVPPGIDDSELISPNTAAYKGQEQVSSVFVSTLSIDGHVAVAAKLTSAGRASMERGEAVANAVIYLYTN